MRPSEEHQRAHGCTYGICPTYQHLLAIEISEAIDMPIEPQEPKHRPDTVLSHEEIVAAFEDAIGLLPRDADVEVIKLLGGTVEDTAQYIWDHWLGEPDYPTVSDVIGGIQEALSGE